MTKTRIDGDDRCQLYTCITSDLTTVDMSTLCDDLDSIEMTETYNGEDVKIASNSKFDKIRETEDHYHVNVFTQDDDGDTILHNAIILQNPEYAFQCIRSASSPVQLSIKNNLCQTPLHLAVLTKQTPVARRLIVGGADIESRDINGNTALHIACRDGYIEMATALLEPIRYIETKHTIYHIPYQKIPQNLELSNYEGTNFLQLVAVNGHYDLVKLLLEKGANINSKDVKTGRTILHCVCLHGNINLVKLLLQYPECELNAKTYDGYYPFDLARARGHHDVIKELAVAGAQYGDSDEEMES